MSCKLRQAESLLKCCLHPVLRPGDETVSVAARSSRGDPAIKITRDYIAHPARLVVNDIGYEQLGFHWDKASIKVYLHGQSVDIAQGVVSTGNEGAGDHGYVCRETPELMPGPTYYAHGILKRWYSIPPGKLARKVTVDT
jgi:S-adenosylmethionine synthetase